MRKIQRVELKQGSQEELLPGFSREFPYIASHVELDHFRRPYVPWHWHRTAELFYMESGSLKYTTPKGTWTFPAGTGGFVNANVLHSTEVTPSQGSTIQLLHLFDPSFLSGERGSRMEKKYILPLVSAQDIEMIPLYPENSIHAEILQCIRKAFDLSEESWGYEFRLRNALTDIWMKLLELYPAETSRTGASQTSNETIKQMMLYIQEQYSQSISVQALADAAYISKRACFRIFQENLHMTPLEYIRSYRLQKACQMLISGDASMTDIANACGLGSSSYFGKVFRDEFGCTPQRYRKQWHDSDKTRQK